jgi:hypothetical protein
MLYPPAQSRLSSLLFSKNCPAVPVPFLERFCSVEYFNGTKLNKIGDFVIPVYPTYRKGFLIVSSPQAVSLFVLEEGAG